MTENINPKEKILFTIIKNERILIIFLVLMIFFPFAMNLITGTGLNEGVTKFWQGQLIVFFIN